MLGFICTSSSSIKGRFRRWDFFQVLIYEDTAEELVELFRFLLVSGCPSAVFPVEVVYSCPGLQPGVGVFPESFGVGFHLPRQLVLENELQVENMCTKLARFYQAL